MDITILKKQGRVMVTIVELSGKMDGSNHMQLVDEAKEIYNNGLHDLLIDLRKLTFMNSSGLAAIHKIGLLFNDPPKYEEEPGRRFSYAFDRDPGFRVFSRVKLFSPQPKVAYALYVAGFDTLFEIHTDLNAAVGSF